MQIPVEFLLLSGTTNAAVSWPRILIRAGISWSDPMTHSWVILPRENQRRVPTILRIIALAQMKQGEGEKKSKSTHTLTCLPSLQICAILWPMSSVAPPREASVTGFW
jgi:hypothetical protein